MEPPKLNKRLEELLGTLLKTGNTPQRIAKRAQIIVDLYENLGTVPVTQIAKTQRQDRVTIYRWYKRWEEHVDDLFRLEEAGSDDKTLTEKLREVLSDAPRSGAPPCVHRGAGRSDRGPGLRESGGLTAPHQPLDDQGAG